MEKGHENVGSGPGLHDQNHTAVEDAVCVAALDLKSNDVLVKVKETLEKLETKNVFLHGDSVAEKAAPIPALTDDIRLKREERRWRKRRESLRGC